MIKVSVMYPYKPGARFDHDYYRDKHMPMVKERLGSACAYYTVDKGLAGGAPGQPPAYVGKCDLLFHTLDGFQSSMAKHGEEIMGDIPNYTDLQPVVMVSEVVVEHS
jgi:uncharacterized protein (TIGR02118 family)